MERVTHTCGTQLWRQETGGVARVVHYYGLKDEREIHYCPQCGGNLYDRVLTGEDGRKIKEDSGTA